MTSAPHDKHHGDAACYLLGAMPELEATAFERHVMGCASCRDEVERLRPAVQALPLSVQPLRAPETLGESLMAQVRDEARAASAPSASTGRKAFRRLTEGTRETRRRVRPAAAWASAAVLLVAGIVLGLGAQGVLEPDDRTVAATIDESRLTEGSATLLVSESDDRAFLSVSGLPALPSDESGEIYQLWLVRGNEVIPSSLFSVGDDGSGTATILEGVEDADAVWVTREEAGGSRAPTESPVMRINLSGA